MKLISLRLFVLLTATPVFAHEYHVALNGADDNPGTQAAPLRTIQHAADLAQPGDVITVHAGIYRERVSPPRGGESDAKRITYQAAPGEKVTITGSEPVKGWQKVSGDIWKVVLPSKYFGAFNPYSDLIHGDWYNSNRPNHTGAVYLHGAWLPEAKSLEEEMKPPGGAPRWFATVDGTGSGHDPVSVEPPKAAAIPAVSATNASGINGAGNTTIWAEFKGVDPNQSDVEINVRKTVFSPEKTGINYITLRGFTLRNAATNWAPPTAGQVGLVTAYWCKGWIIEDNDVAYSRCCGVALGKYGDQWDNKRTASAQGYVGTLTRALKEGWNKATVGSHLVRNNHISFCGQTGLVGSLGCSYSTVTGNDIHDIHLNQPFNGAEMAGIKFHGAIDVTICDNHIYRCGTIAGIWLDWMAQGAHVTGNLMHDNTEDIFLEMQHGPILLANNLLLSRSASCVLNSQGVAFAHNLLVGRTSSVRGDTRITPFLQRHSTEVAGMYPTLKGDSGDDRFYNNIFVAPCSLSSMNNLALPCLAAGNVFTKGSQASSFDKDPVVQPDFAPGLTLTEKPDGWYLQLALDNAWTTERKRALVTTELMGKAVVPDQGFENPDGSAIKVDKDYFGRQRNADNPSPGPFEIQVSGTQSMKIWPKSN